MEYKKRKRNRPISIAIKGYLDKSGGKVTASRNVLTGGHPLVSLVETVFGLSPFIINGITNEEKDNASM